MRYIVAVDGSTESERAIKRAVEYARQMGASLEVVHSVTRDVSEDESGNVIESPVSAEEKGHRVLERAAQRCRDEYDFEDVETTLLRGDAGSTVSDYANETEADGVFVGHRGLSSEHEALVGSVAKRLIDRTRMPVVVVGAGE